MGSDWMPLVAGILDLVAGVPALLLGIVIAAKVGAPPSMVTALGFGGLWGMLHLLAIPLIIAGIIALAGGLAALKKKVWWLALAGSVAAFPCLVGIPAFVFTITGRKRFA